jgi:flagellar basal-body rod protein FlgC
MADIYSIIGSALNAQNARMDVIAGNLANVDSVTQPGGTPYRAHEVVFEAGQDADGGDSGGVSVAGTVLSNAPPRKTYDPSSPFADGQGFVTGSNVSQPDQLVDLIDSANSYSASVAVLAQASRIDQQLISSIQVSS